MKSTMPICLAIGSTLALLSCTTNASAAFNKARAELAIKTLIEREYLQTQVIFNNINPLPIDSLTVGRHFSYRRPENREILDQHLIEAGLLKAEEFPGGGIKLVLTRRAERILEPYWNQNSGLFGFGDVRSLSLASVNHMKITSVNVTPPRTLAYASVTYEYRCKLDELSEQIMLEHEINTNNILNICNQEIRTGSIEFFRKPDGDWAYNYVGYDISFSL